MIAMRRGGVRVEVLGISIVLVIALVAGFVGTRGVKPRLNPGPRRHSQAVIAVLKQEAGRPGKVISVKQEGVELLHYICKPDDAAILVFTMRDNTTASDYSPAVQSAKDGKGNEYITTITTSGGIYLVSIKAGFSQKPNSIDLAVLPPMARFGASPTILKVSNIADSKRVLEKPTRIEADQAERVARVEIDDTTGWPLVKCMEKVGANESDSPSIIATSFSDPAIAWFPTSMRSGVDCAKVRIDRYRYTDEKATLTYYNAKVEKINGRNFLSLPVDESIGKLLGHDVFLSNQSPRWENRPVRNNAANQEIRLRWDNDNARFDTSIRAQVPEASSLKLRGITPSVESMGLDSLHILLQNRPGIWVGINGFDLRPKADHHPDAPKSESIPKIDFHIDIKKSTKVSTRFIVVPVHHVKSNSPPRQRPRGRGRDRMSVAAP